MFQQIPLSAIGTKLAPTYACIYVDRVEQDFLKTQELQPLLWLRFIDDISFICTHGKEELKTFMEKFNNFTPHLKFTYESSEKNISFLDLIITVSEQKLKTTLRIKSTDRHQYLHYASSHPEHTERSVVFNQTLRISRLCSEENDFKNYRSQMKSWFLKRGYPEKLIENEMRKVKFGKEGIKKAKGVKGIPFVVTYHPQLKNLGRIINQNIYLLNMNEETKKVFSPRPMVSFRSPRKISSYLVRAKLYPLDRVVGSTKCGKKRCEVCMNISETNTFTSNVTGETYKINHKLTCDDNCLIYLLSCKCCGKQYVGETTDSFRYRWNNYKDNDRKHSRNESCMQEHLFEHFNSMGHNGFLNNISIALIDNKREDYWRKTLKICSPFGLNVGDSV